MLLLRLQGIIGAALAVASLAVLSQTQSSLAPGASVEAPVGTPAPGAPGKPAPKQGGGGGSGGSGGGHTATQPPTQSQPTPKATPKPTPKPTPIATTQSGKPKK